jgi:hypothetical protein
MVLSFVAARPMWHAADEMFSIVTVRGLAESRHPFLLAHLPAAATLGGVKE